MSYGFLCTRPWLTKKNHKCYDMKEEREKEAREVLDVHVSVLKYSSGLLSSVSREVQNK